MKFKLEIFKAYTKQGLLDSLEFSREKAEESNASSADLKKVDELLTNLKLAIRDADYDD